jgi:hypothetical protein
MPLMLPGGASSPSSVETRAMRIALPIILSSILAACAHTHPPAAKVPPEEAAWFKFPYELPEAGKKAVSGAMATAIQLAMDDFLPRGWTPSRDSTPQDICLWQRQSYDIAAFPGSGDLIWVVISLSAGACTWGPGPMLDMGATYAIDTASWRVLAVRSP